VVERFRLCESKRLDTSLGHHAKLLVIQAPNFEEGGREINIIQYANESRKSHAWDGV